MSYPEFDLNKFAVSPKRFVALEAGAGSGKTYTLIEIVIKLVREGTPIRKILMVTFTKAAAREMRQRIREKLEELVRQNPEDSLLTTALNSLGSMRVSTIHAFCHRALREFGPEAGFPPVSETVTNGRDLAMDIAQDWVRLHPEHADRIAKLITIVKWKIKDDECSMPKAFEATEFKAYIQKRVEEANRQQATNDSIIRQLVEALKEEAHGSKATELKRIIREEFDVCMVDECQDTDRYQWEIFQSLFGAKVSPAKMLIAVGDRNQSIYGFRGADVDNYIRAQKGAEILTLTANNRSSETLIHIFNAIFQNHQQDSFFRDGTDFPEIKIPQYLDKKTGKTALQIAQSRNLPAPLKVVTGSSEADVAREVQKLLIEFNSGRKEPDPNANIAVLTRDGKSAVKIHRELILQGIPASLSSTKSVFSQPLASIVYQLLNCILKPEKTEDRRTLLFSSPSLFDIRCDLDEFIDQNEEALIAWLRDCRETWTEKGLGAAWPKITQVAPKGLCSIKESFAKNPLRTRHLTDLDHLGELLATRERIAQLSPIGLVKMLALAINDDADSEDAMEEEQIRPESAYPQVVVQTLHAAKGLQYHGVIIPNMGKSRENKKGKVDGLLRSNQGSKLVFDDATDEDFEAYVDQSGKEEARLLYVALTRACRKVVLLWTVADFDEHSTGLGPALMKAGFGSTPEEFINNLNTRLANANQTDFRLNISEVEPVNSELAKQSIVTPKPITLSEKFPEDSRNLKPHYIKLNTSYSKLTEEEEHDPKKPDPSKGESLPFMEFKGGKNAGDALHKLLEELDFTKSSDLSYLLKLTQKHLEKNGIYVRDPAKFQKGCELVTNAIPKWMNSPLSDSGIKLCQLTQQNRMSEVRFSLLCNTTHTSEWGTQLKEIFQKEYESQPELEVLAEVEFSQEDIDGLLIGSIDLVFSDPQGGATAKTYIIDWKSNMIGKGSDSYTRAGMAHAIADHKYHLQYALYSAALHLYMKACKGDQWNYERDFGGCHYLFLRSFGEVAGTGDFHYRPSWEHIKAILETLGHQNVRA